MYDVGLKNTIFESKHHEKMGMALWLYAWFVDRVTKEKDGYGYVLGGVPVCYAKVGVWLKERTYTRYVAILRDSGYIKTQRTARGLIVLITKTKKRYANNGTSVKSDTPLLVSDTPLLTDDTPQTAELKDTTKTLQRQYSGSDEPRLENSLFSKGKSMEELTYEYIGKKKQPTGIRKDIFRIGRWYDNAAREELKKLGQKVPSELFLIMGAGKVVLERIKKFGRDEVVKMLQKYLKSNKFVEHPRLTSALSADTVVRLQTDKLE